MQLKSTIKPLECGIIPFLIIGLFIFFQQTRVHAKEGFSIGLDMGVRKFIGSDMSGVIDAGPEIGVNATYGFTESFYLSAHWMGSMHVGEGIEGDKDVKNFFVGPRIIYIYSPLPGHQLYLPSTGDNIRHASNDARWGWVQDAP